MRSRRWRRRRRVPSGRPAARTRARSTGRRAGRPPCCVRRRSSRSRPTVSGQRVAERVAIASGPRRRTSGRRRPGWHRERRPGREHECGDVGETVEADPLVRDAGVLLEAAHDRVVELPLGREVPVHRALADPGVLGDRPKRERPPVPGREPADEGGGGAEDALARLGHLPAAHRAVVAAAFPGSAGG